MIKKLLTILAIAGGFGLCLFFVFTNFKIEKESTHLTSATGHKLKGNPEVSEKPNLRMTHTSARAKPDLRLQGTWINLPNSHCLIKFNDGQIHIMKVGDQIDGVNISKIYHKKVEYIFNRTKYELRLEGLPSPYEVDFSEYELDEDVFFSLMKMQITPTGSIMFRLLDPNLTYEDFGLRTNDQVTHINEQPIVEFIPISEDQKSLLLKQDVLLLTVLREGESIDIEIDVN